jgi:hypothetical protein
MASLFGTSTPANAPTPAETSLRVQTSIEGLPRTILWGQTRIAANLIWYGDFRAVAVTAAASSGGGKGGLFTPNTAPTSSGYNYFASVEMALCEGPIASVADRMWASKAVGSMSLSNIAAFAGDNAQLPWSYLTTVHPGQDFGYRYTCYLVGNVSLGTSPELPNWTFEVLSTISEMPVLGIPDADPTQVIADFLSNPHYGVPGWSVAYNGDWSNAQNYTFSADLLISYALTSQVSASSFLDELVTSLNIDAVWSEATLKLVPRGDTLIFGNGRAYFPPAAPLYDLTDADYLPNQSSFGSTNADPVSCKQIASRSQNNIVKVQYLLRESDYNQVTAIAQDDGAILLYGERGNNNVKSWLWFQESQNAYNAAWLALGREQIANYYSVTVRPRFILLDPGDIITLTDSNLGLFRQWVRIKDIQENADRSINIQAEEHVQGSGLAPLYGPQARLGSKPNYYVEPGPINPPYLFEPPDELAHGLFVYAGISGVNPQTYGGCDVYVSFDAVNYTRVPGGRAFGSARMGVTTSSLPPVTENVNGLTIDIVNTLSVDLSMSEGELDSVSQTDALAGNSLCWLIDPPDTGHAFSYMTATLTGPYKYNLSYLVRGLFGSGVTLDTHPSGMPILRIDNSILKIPYDQSLIGSTIYLKFLPFNVWGATVDTLAEVPAYTYTLQGTALASPLPPVTQVRTVVKDRFEEIWWQEVDDFRQSIRYIIRKGDSFLGGQELGTLAHPPFVAFGSGTYWIMPTCQPVAGLIVYSDTPVSITISGNMLTANIVQTTDFQALGWPGVFTNVGKEGVDPHAFVRLVGTADILTNPDIIHTADILNSGVVSSTGTWLSSTQLDVGYVADCYVNITWTSAGVTVGTDILTTADILNAPDILSAGTGQFVEVWVEIQTAGPFAADMFIPPDIFDASAVPDVFNTGAIWSAWQRYVPGVYRAEHIAYRVVFSTVEPTIIAYLTSLVAQVTIPARIDHYMGNSVGTGGLQIIFMPDDATLALPFNGGPLVGGINNHPLPAVSMDWTGHPEANFVIDSLDLHQITFHFADSGGSHIAMTGVDTYVEGY